MSIESMGTEYLTIKAERLELTKRVNLLEQAEKSLRDQILIAMRGEPGTVLDGAIEATILLKPNAVIEDWIKLEEYIREQGAIDLLQKRLTPSAVKLRWDDGLTIPGIARQEVPDLTIKLVGE